MKFRYIESWCVGIELDEDTLRDYGLEGLSSDEVAYHLSTGDVDLTELSPQLFAVGLDGRPCPAEGYEIYETDWESAE